MDSFCGTTRYDLKNVTSSFITNWQCVRFAEQFEIEVSY